MSFPFLKDLSTREVERLARAALDEYVKTRGMDHHTLLIDAEFYLRELRRREERRSRRFDLFLELVIIALIGWEIHEGREQAKILERQSAILEQVQKALTRAGNTNPVR